MNAAATHLLRAVRRARYASARTQQMVRVAIARYFALLAIERAAA